jgi:hypothetical protein
MTTNARDILRAGSMLRHRNTGNLEYLKIGL